MYIQTAFYAIKGIFLCFTAYFIFSLWEEWRWFHTSPRIIQKRIILAILSGFTEFRGEFISLLGLFILSIFLEAKMFF